MSNPEVATRRASDGDEDELESLFVFGVWPLLLSPLFELEFEFELEVVPPLGGGFLAVSPRRMLP